MHTSEETFGIATKGLVYVDGKYLILYKSNHEDINPNTYDIPGGRLKFGEEPELALKRELLEEVGLTIQIGPITECWTMIKTKFQLFGVTYLCFAETNNVEISEEHQFHKWVESKEIEESDIYPKWLKKSIMKAEQIRQQNQ